MADPLRSFAARPPNFGGHLVGTKLTKKFTSAKKISTFLPHHPQQRLRCTPTMASVEGYDFSKFIAMMVYIKKTTPDLSIVKRLGGSGAAKVVQTERKTKFYLTKVFFLRTSV